MIICVQVCMCTFLDITNAEILCWVISYAQRLYWSSRTVCWFLALNDNILVLIRTEEKQSVRHHLFSSKWSVLCVHVTFFATGLCCCGPRQMPFFVSVPFRFQLAHNISNSNFPIARDVCRSQETNNDSGTKTERVWVLCYVVLGERCQRHLTVPEMCHQRSAPRRWSNCFALPYLVARSATFSWLPTFRHCFL